MVSANEAFYVLLQGVLVNVIVNQNNTNINKINKTAKRSRNKSPYKSQYAYGETMQVTFGHYMC